MSEPLDRAATATILAIDPGKVSGWAVFADGELLRCGEARNARERLEVVRDAMSKARERGRRLIVVAERWQGKMRPGRKSIRTVSGLGASWGKWAESLELEGHPKRRVVRVPPFDWYRVLPNGGPRTAKGRAVFLCRLKWPQREWSDEEHNVAEAVCIGLWGMKSPRVGKLVLRQKRGAA